MDRIMTRKLRRLLLILFVVVITVISIISYESAIANFENDMSQIINQIVDTYNSYREDEERLNELFTRDYTNRAKAINYVLSLEKQMNLSLLQRVADVMGVEGIDLIDSHGKVVMSSLGQYLDKDVLSMFEKNDGTELKFNVNIERQEYIIVKTPCTIEGYGSLIIRVNQDIYNQCLDDLDMSELMSDVPTISEETYFVVQSNNDKILGITSNNEQDIQIQGTPDISKQLEACVNGKILHINGEYQYVKTIVKDNMIFGCMLTMSSLFLDLFLQIVGIFVALVFIFLSIYILVRYTIEKYFSNDLKLIEHSVDQLMNRNFETQLEKKEDQELKYKVRDAVLEYMNNIAKDCTSKEEVINLAYTYQNEFKKIAEEVIQKNCYNYDVSVKIGNFEFPTKYYGDISLPAGFYDALRIEIGEASGQNWWCVMFPPLCFVDVTSGVVPDESKEIMKDSLNDEEYSLISDNESSDIKFKFSLIEFFQNINLAKRNN